MLKFIYTDKVDDLECNANDLFKAADHYQIDLLKGKYKGSVPLKMALPELSD